MLVTFQSRAHADITLFGEVARTLLKMMGHSATVPGALRAEDVAEAHSRLQAALQKLEPAERLAATGEDDEEQEFRPGLALRALPVLQLLEASAREGCEVLWS